MEPLKNDSFGLLIAYVLPGFIGLSGISVLSETVRSWLGASSAYSPTVGGFLYVTLASTALGLLISTVRWAVIDRLHHVTGIRKPSWNFSTLQVKFEAFEGLVQNHYRYYQAYANSLLALVAWYLSVRLKIGEPIAPLWTDIGILLVLVVLFAGSRDALRNYYERGSQLLGEKTYVVVDVITDQD